MLKTNKIEKQGYKIYYNAAVYAQTELEYRTVIDAEEGSTNESMEREMIEHSVETVDTE